MALGTRPRGVPIPLADIRGLGVEYGDEVLRDGDDNPEETRVGDECCCAEVCEGVSVPFMVLSCLAVMSTYLEAREPDVILSARETVFAAVGVVALLDLARVRRRAARAAGVSADGVARFADGVTRPLIAGVARAFLKDVDGVIRPERDGVIRPLRDEATEDGRCTTPGPTVGRDSFIVATKTPHLSGQMKYTLLGSQGKR